MQPFDANQPNEARYLGVAPSGKVKQGTNQPPAILNTAPSPSTLFRCLQRRLVLALFLGGLLALGGATLAYFVAPEPKHEVRMLINMPTPGHEIAHTGEKLPDTMSFQRNQMALAKSRVVLAEALKDAKVAKLPLVQEKIDAVEWLEKEIYVDFSVAPEIMKISMRGLNTDDLLPIVDAVYKAFQKEVGDQRKNDRQTRLKFLDDMVAQYENKLKFKREAEKTPGLLNAPKNPQVQAVLVAYHQQLVAGSQRDAVAARSALSRAKSNLANLKATQTVKKVEVREVDVVAAMSRNFELGQLKTYLGALEGKLKGIEERATKGKNDPFYRATETELKKARSELAKTEKRVRAETVKTLEEFAAANVTTALALLEQEVARQEAAIQHLDAEVKQGQDKLIEVGKQNDALEIVKEDISHIEKMLQTLRQQQQAMQLEIQVGPKNKIIENPSVVRVDGERRKLMIAGGAGAGLFLLCLFGMAYLEYRTRKVADVDDVVVGLGMRLVGTVPNARKAAKPSSAYAASGKRVPSVAQQVLTESIDAARTTLLHLARSHSLRTVMVTSAVAGEGKTSLSCHLSASLARAGLRVLLIDADMRNPSAHKLFGMPCETGFSEVLCDKAQLQDCIKDTPLRNLAILAAGQWTDQTAAALNQGKAATLFAQLRDQYDIIVVDSSPVLPVADALLLGQQVDAVVLSVLCEVSRLNNLYAAWTRVQEHGGQPLGVVINGVWGTTYGATYHYPYPRKKAKKVKA